MKKLSVALTITILAGLLLAACATPTPITIVETVEVPGPERTVVVKETVVVEPEPKTVVEFWSTDHEAERVLVYEQVAADFMAEHPDIEVRIVPIDEGVITQHLATAQGANRLPDVLRHGVERIAPFVASGILDTDAATRVITDLGEDTFFEGPLNWVTDPATGNYAAVPFDGWIQAIWYRADAFEDLGLDAPVTWDAIEAGCEAIAGYDDYLYGITIGTDPAWNYGHQIFEQMAMSNGALPFDEEGNVTMDSPEMIETLAFYTGLQDCATPAPSYWLQGRANYVTGLSGMLFYSTYVMDDIAGLRPDLEVTVDDLAAKTGFSPVIQGPSGDEATYGQLVTVSITTGADTEAAVEFVKYLMEGDAYLSILGLSPHGKLPQRTTAVEGWATLDPETFGSYDPAVLEAIFEGFESAQRWAFVPEYDQIQRAAIGDLEGRLFLIEAFNNIIDGVMTPETAADWLQIRMQDLYDARLAEAEE